MSKETTDNPPHYYAAGLRTLQSMTVLERQMLREYYVNRKPLRRICAELGVTPDEFARARRRAQAIFSDLKDLR